MQLPFFSIITVCLNAGTDLQKTIFSVLKQEFQDFNIIVKDGYSEDGSFESIPDNDRVLKIQRKDCGIYDAMNQSLDYAHGQYLLFLNAGDLFYDSSVLDSFYNTIINNNFPGLVYCDYTTTGLGEYVQSPHKLTKLFLFRTMLCHQVCMIKREFYERIGYFNKSFKVDADYDFLLRLLIVNKVSYKYVQKLGVISTSKGFSFQNKKLAKKEVLLIRKSYYPRTYFYYAFLLSLTLPSFREKVARKANFLSKFYQRLVNTINRLF